MTATRIVDRMGKAQQFQEPQPALLSFLDALAELLADQILRELRKPVDHDAALVDLHKFEVASPKFSFASNDASATTPHATAGVVHLTRPTSTMDSP